MVKYNKSIIYKICCKNPEIKEIYIGSTANELRKRKNQHKTDSNNINSKSYNLYVYQFIRDNGGFDNWDIVEVERYCANDKQELHKRERYYIELLGASLNSQIPNRSQKEYEKDNKDKIKEYKQEDKYKEKVKEYYQANKDKILEKQREKVECDICNKILSRHSLLRHKKNIHK